MVIKVTQCMIKDLICSNENGTETGSTKTDNSELLNLVLMTGDRSRKKFRIGSSLKFSGIDPHKAS